MCNGMRSQEWKCSWRTALFAQRDPTATTRWGNQYSQLSTNHLLRAAIDPAVEKFKKDNKGNKEAIVEPNESNQGSKAGRAVAATEIGLSSDSNQDLEGFLSYRYDIKETIEHKGFCTGAQSLMLLYDIKETFCNPSTMLETKELPTSLKMADRSRASDIKRADQLEPMIDEARVTLSKELQARCFDARTSTQCTSGPALHVETDERQGHAYRETVPARSDSLSSVAACR
eukprot:1462362-Prymnesium_polylepis.1